MDIANHHSGWVKLENSNDTVSKGQLIFLVRRVTSPEECIDLLTKQYIFANPDSVATALHRILSVPLEHTLPLLEDMQNFCDSTASIPLRPATLYAGVAIVQATPFDGLRILLEQENRSHLPMREICSLGSSGAVGELSGTLEEIGAAITWLDGMSLLSIITRNISRESQQSGGRRVARLVSALERALVPMLDDLLTVEDMGHILPRLLLHPVLVPLTPGGDRASNASGYVPPYLIVFCANYDAAVNTFTDKWLPFSLFRAQNACVMAQRIKAAAQTETYVADVVEGPHHERRPSRVQFETPSPMSETGSSPAGSTPGGNGMSSGSYFQPRHDDSTFPGFSGLTRNPSTRSINAPARSSFATQPRFYSTGTGESSKHMQTSYPAPGIATWDPDWLLALLRAKLSADA